MHEELSYWLALAHLPNVRTKKKNEIIVRLFEEQKSIIDFFHYGPGEWKEIYAVDEGHVVLLENAVKELSNYAFMVEDLVEQGYDILPITSPDYPPALKKNLGRTYAPPLIYTKGNKQVLKEKSIAIVGSRKAGETSLLFTDNVAKKASEDYRVVVSGFAKGVDKQALDSALKYKGQSIIVLPQGIATFKSGFKKYYRQIIEGSVLVLSTFYPKAPWSVEFAMARNPIIYGLATEIYVAESSEKGGTWSGVMDGLKKRRKIYVRKPGPEEKNANSLLIEKGALPVDVEGGILTYENPTLPGRNVVSEPDPNDTGYRIIELLKRGVYTAEKIVEALKLDWSARKVSMFLKDQENVRTVQGKPQKFTHAQRPIESQTTLF